MKHANFLLHDVGNFGNVIADLSAFNGWIAQALLAMKIPTDDASQGLFFSSFNSKGLWLDDLASRWFPWGKTPFLAKTCYSLVYFFRGFHTLTLALKLQREGLLTWGVTWAASWGNHKGGILLFQLCQKMHCAWGIRSCSKKVRLQPSEASEPTITILASNCETRRHS